jgi:hypothetical protein
MAETIENQTTGEQSNFGGNNAQLDSLIEKGKEYLDTAVDAAKNNPWTTAAIGAGVVAATAATAFGATKLAQHLNESNSGGNSNSRGKGSSSKSN